MFIIIYKGEKTLKAPKIIHFDSNETEAINMYWECVRKLKEHKIPEIKIECNILDLKKITKKEGEDILVNYNVGDYVTIKLPYQKTRVKARIIKTEKHERNHGNDHLEIGNHQINYGNNYIRRITDNQKITGIKNSNK